MHLDYFRRSITVAHFRSTSAHEEKMANAKTATLSFRIEPALKEALRTVAEQEHRSIANMVEVMIREYCGRLDVAAEELPAPTGRRQAITSAQKKSPRTKKTT